LIEESGDRQGIRPHPVLSCPRLRSCGYASCRRLDRSSVSLEPGSPELVMNRRSEPRYPTRFEPVSESGVT
jgi:hypothetical protein